MRATHVAWFNGRVCIGIVRVEDPYGPDHYRIGGVQGYSEADDIQSVVDYGARFDQHAGDVMLAENRFTKL